MSYHHHHHHNHHGYPGGYPPQIPVVMGNPVMYAPPPVGYPPAPVYGAPVGYAPSYSMPPPPAGFIIPQYTPGLYQYQQPYYRQHPFVLPYGLPPHLAAKMMQASATFRAFDTNFSGSLDKREWKRAMQYLNYYMPKGYAKHLFYMVDRDRSGKISEREFCEWWLATH